MRQREIEQSAQYAAQQAQQLAGPDPVQQQQQHEMMQRANEEHERVLRERIEALQRREYRRAAPLACVACAHPPHLRVADRGCVCRALV